MLVDWDLGPSFRIFADDIPVWFENFCVYNHLWFQNFYGYGFGIFARLWFRNFCVIHDGGTGSRMRTG